MNESPRSQRAAFGAADVLPAGFGLGTADLARRRGIEKIDRIFHTAVEEGVTHFDTAPMYGLGQAEELLGRFIRTRRDTLTVTTKVGLLPPPAIPARVLPARFMRGPLTPGRVDFGLASVRASFERSLRLLRTDHVDVLLLHGCEPGHITDDLLEFLAGCVSRGEARATGIATSYEETRSIVAGSTPLPVVQVPWDPVRPQPIGPPVTGDGPVITHSSVLPVLERFAEVTPEQIAGWSAELSVDCANSDVAAGLAVAAAAANESTHVALFASRRPERLRATCALAREYAAEPGRLRRFEQLLA